MISVVIPAYNEEEYIASCLESFEHQTTKEKFEIILVDNASTDKTVEIATTFLNKIPLKIISEPRKGRGFARRAGFAVAKGDIIFSTDADSYAPSNWIERMVDPFRKTKVVAVTGPIKIVGMSSVKNICTTLGLDVVMRAYRILYHHFWLTGSNFGIRKEVYKKSGGFTPVNGLEDIDLGWRVQKEGVIQYVPIYMNSSGRRWGNIWKGWRDYFLVWKEYFVYKNKNIYLSDARN